MKTLFIEPGSPWENGYVESFNGKFRDECLNGEIFYTLTEAKVLIERCVFFTPDEAALEVWNTQIVAGDEVLDGMSRRRTFQPFLAHVCRPGDARLQI